MSDALNTARRVLAIETDALNALSKSLDGTFTEVVAQLHKIEGRVILAGVGKSGHVARKVAATLASTGTPAIYIHPTEASHGDMGMIRRGDAVLALSRSGETGEMADMIAYCKRYGVMLIAMTAKPDSTLGKAADYVLALPDVAEACATTRAPTTSTTLQIALGDALAVALLEAKGFTASDFRDFHPGGQLGAQMLTLEKLMHTDMPLVESGRVFDDALETLSAKGFGCVGVTKDGRLIGMITDGDIRRHLRGGGTLGETVDAVMTKGPVTGAPEDLAGDTLALMTDGERRITQLFVVEAERPVGILHLHDLLRAGVA